MADLFICHASEDKEGIARQLAQRLKGSGYQVWYDEFSLKLGDSLPREVDRGLAACRYGVVILSPNFFRKEWPRRELDGLVARETQDGQKRILPVWHDVSQEVVAQYSPTLASRLAVRSSEGLEKVVQEVVRAVGPADLEPDQASAGSSLESTRSFPQSVNIPAGYLPQLNHRRFQIAKEKAARNPQGGYTYPVELRGRDENARAFTKEAVERLGARALVTQAFDGVTDLRFIYSGQSSPDRLERLAIKHGLHVVRCGPDVVF
jgi:TIR domain-containing protein